MLWLLNKLHLVKGVWLRDMWGQVYRSFATRNPFGGWDAALYPWTRIGRVHLHENGRVTSSDAKYVTAYKFMR